MNSERRKQISTAISNLTSLKEKFEDEKNTIESLKDEEQEYYDNMPESFQQGDKGSASEEAISSLDAALEELSEIESRLEDAISNLENSTQ